MKPLSFCLRPLCPWLLLPGLIFFAGCKKSPLVPVVPAFTPGATVYMAGAINSTPTYWKNGTAVSLGGTGNAECIYVSGTDVYVCGYMENATDIYAVYWKNGVQTKLTQSGIAHAFGIATLGNDVYCVGDMFGANNVVKPVCWKNDSVFDLAANSSGIVQSILFSDTNMYVNGYVWAPNQGFDTAGIWRNGVFSWYTIGGAGGAGNIAVSGNKVYAAANTGSAVLFLDGDSSYFLPAGSYKQAFATAVYVAGSDIYIAGDLTDAAGNGVAAYWKNRVLDTLENTVKATPDVSLTGIASAGQDVYAIGMIIANSNYSPVYWKNGHLSKLADNGMISSICVGP